MNNTRSWLRHHPAIFLLIILIAVLVIALSAFSSTFGQTLSDIDTQSVYLDSVINSQIRTEIDAVLSSASELVSMISSNTLVHQFSSLGKLNSPAEHYSLYELLQSLAPYRNIVLNNRLILDFAVYYPESDVLINKQSYYKPQYYYETLYGKDFIPFADWSAAVSSNSTGAFVPEISNDSILAYVQSLDMSGPSSAAVIVFFNRPGIEKMTLDLERPGVKVVLRIGSISIPDSVPEELSAAIEELPAGAKTFSSGSGWTVTLLSSNSFHNAIYYICKEGNPDGSGPNISVRKFYSRAVTLAVIIAVATLLATLFFVFLPVRKKIRIQHAGQDVNPVSMMKDSINLVFSRNGQNPSDSEWLIIKDALLDLLTYSEYTHDEVLDTLSRHNIVFGYPYFLIALFSFSGKVPSEVFHSISDSCNEKYRGTISSACFPVGRDRFAALFNLSAEDIPYLPAVEEIKSSLQEHTGSESTVFIGSIQEGTANIHQSYTDAAALFEYRIFTGGNAVLDHNSFRHSDTGYYYPMDIELNLISAVSNGNSDKASELLRTVHDENFVRRQLRPDIAKLLLNELAGTMLKISQGADPEVSGEASTDILKCETVEEVFYTLQEFCMIICLGHQGSAESKRKAEFRQYIMQHFTDADFSQGSMAEDLNVSQNYLSAQFKKYFGVNMNSYVSSLRVEKAAEMLKTTDTPVQDISVLCGFSTGDALARVFKKQYGVTPSEYRSGL